MPHAYHLSLAHINDTHSNFEPSQVKFTLQHQAKPYQVNVDTGGYARIAFQVEQLKKQANKSNHPCVFLHGGDSFQGTLYFREFQGSANAHLLNLLMPDAMVLGNHEIDAGNGPVEAFLNRIEFPLMAGNMDLSQEQQHKPARLADHPQLLDYDSNQQIAKVLLKPFYDTQLAIIGITLDQMALIARPDPDTLFVNAIETTRRTVQHLHQQGIKHIIVLSHLGLDQDRELAEKVTGISLIIGGHSHTLQGDMSALGLSNMPYGESINNTPIFHAGKYAETIGLVDLEMDSEGKVITFNGNNYFMLGDKFDVSQADEAPIDDNIKAALKQQLFNHPCILGAEQIDDIHQVIHTQYRPALLALESQILAHIPKDFIHTRLPSKNFPHGSEIAPWVSRSMYKTCQSIEPKLDFALHNAGGVRQSLTKGQLSVADVFGRILPFELPLVIYQIQGKYIVEVLESAINAATNNGIIGTGAGSFPYPYGLRYSYDGKLAAGERITDVEIYRNETWQPLNRNELYIGVSSSYTASGREGYGALLNAIWQQSIEHKTLPEAFIDFVNTYGYKIGQQPIININYISHR